ncbi:MAG: FliG C-terminal domain-containing protein [Pseudomonadota bacterium]
MSMAGGGALLIDESPEPEAQTTPATLGTMDKAAIILAALGPDDAARLIAGLNEVMLRKCAHAISNLKRIPAHDLDKVISEFIGEMDADPGVIGGVQEARRILSGAVDNNTVARIMSDVDGHMRRSIWEQLGSCAESAIARFLQSEHPQTAAVVLSELSASKAAAVLERLDTTMARNVVLRLSRVPRLEDHVMNLIEDVIVQDFLSALQQEMATRKPAEVIGGLMNNVSSDNRDRLMKHLEERKPSLAQEVQKVMFTFGDISVRVEPRDVALVVRAVDEETLMAALKHAISRNIDSAEFMLSNLSKRLSERYREDLDAMQDVKQKDGEAAQTKVIEAIQKLTKAGDITLLEIET